MIDYNLIYFILFFFFWVYILELTIEYSEKIALKYLQFLFSIPLIISIANNSYVNSFTFGYIFCFVIGILSLYIMVSEYIK